MTNYLEEIEIENDLGISISVEIEYDLVTIPVNAFDAAKQEAQQEECIDVIDVILFVNGMGNTITDNLSKEQIQNLANKIDHYGDRI